MAVDGWLDLESCLQVGLVNYQERVVEGTVGESEEMAVSLAVV